MNENLPIGIYDMHGIEIYTNDKVNLFGMTGIVTQISGAYGIQFKTAINWDLLQEKIIDVTRTHNEPAFCFNDNFVSFWELVWNYNCEDDYCDVLSISRESIAKQPR